jgi:ACS family hexuronate transporter-like MFS transporter
MQPVETTNLQSIGTKIGNYRWRICALLFFATTINYIDRNVLSFVMADDGFRREMLGLAATAPLTEANHTAFLAEYGRVDAVFKFAYGLGFILMGWFIDLVGVRKGYAVAIFLWVGSALSHSFATTFGRLRLFRFTLGIGEAGNFPSAIKTVAEWFPIKERSKAVGIFNSGANIGIIFTAALVPVVITAYGWQATFLITSSLGFVLLICWLLLYRRPEEHTKVTQAELEYIRSDGEQETSTAKVNWFKLLSFRQTWTFAMGKFLTDMIWWFYLSFLPDFFKQAGTFQLDLKQLSLPFIIIYIVSDAGSILFGWLSSKFISVGWTQNAARKVTMLLCALCVVPVFFASITESLPVAVALISLAAAAHQGWSANLYSIATDMFPKKAVSSVIGIGGMFGAIGGALFSYNAGTIAGTYGYLPLFIIASSAYLLALGVIQLLSPKLQPARL